MKTLADLCKLVNELDTAHVMALQLLCQERMEAEQTSWGLTPEETALLKSGNRVRAVQLVQARLGLMTDAANRYINRAQGRLP